MTSSGGVTNCYTPPLLPTRYTKRILGYAATVVLAVLICWAVFGDLRCGVSRAGDTVAVVCRSSLLGQRTEVPHG
jgi:hypothetical protein